MNKSEFYMVLPSNSSMDYYPDNVASRYTTLLPKQLELPGEWVVALSEIQFPCNFLHIREKPDTRIVLSTESKKSAGEVETYSHVKDSSSTRTIIPDIKLSYPSGICYSIEDIIIFLNQSALQDHFLFKYDKVTGYVSIRRRCSRQQSACEDRSHYLTLSDKLWTILGFPAGRHAFHGAKDGKKAEIPASLARGLPESFYVYCDLCTPYVTGDVQSSLLRVVPFNSAVYNFGATHCATFHTPHYIPLIRSSIRTVEIDIRNYRGELIPFEYGPLNVTLHFKRTD